MHQLVTLNILPYVEYVDNFLLFVHKRTFFPIEYSLQVSEFLVFLYCPA